MLPDRFPKTPLTNFENTWNFLIGNPIGLPLPGCKGSMLLRGRGRGGREGRRLVINTAYLLSCTVSKLWAYGWSLIKIKFSPARGECLNLSLSLGTIPCQYRHRWHIFKKHILWPTFLLQKVLVSLSPLLRNLPRKLPNSVKLRGS